MPTGGLELGWGQQLALLCDSPANEKPRKNLEKVKSDDSADEEKDQVGLALSFLTHAILRFCNCEFTLGLSVDQKWLRRC